MSFVNVILKRLTTALRTTEAIQDGKIILDYEKPSIYLDNGTARIDMTPRDSALSTTSTNAIENQAVRNAIVNTNTTTVAGFMADARQLNPNETGSLAYKVTEKILWTNPSPTSSFSAQTVTLSETIANFTKYEILFKNTNLVNTIFSTGKLPTSFLTQLCFPIGTIRARNITALSGTSLTFSESGYYGTYGGGYTTDNNGCVPYQIIGYR